MQMPDPDAYRERMMERKKGVDSVPAVRVVDAPLTLSSRSPGLIKIFGCGGCKWMETSLCPHRGDVYRLRHHCNGICSQRLDLPREIAKELRLSGKTMTRARLELCKGIMDSEAILKKNIMDAELGRRDINDALPWQKLILDTWKELVKHDEGSKVSVERRFTPVDLAGLIDKAKLVDAEVDGDVSSEDDSFVPDFDESDDGVVDGG